MVVPSPGPAYNTFYDQSFLEKMAKQKYPRRNLEKLADSIKSQQYRGYAQVTMEYLTDVCKENPKQGGVKWGESRTVLYGVQRPPAYTHSVIRGSCADGVLIRLLPFIATNASNASP